jgi:tRNA(Ile)-lysidine synthase
MLPLKQFENFVKQYELFSSNNRILLAVSGGKDSVLMVHLFKEAGINFSIAHCNFQLREEESLRDEDFVNDLAKLCDVEFFNIRFNTKEYAKTHGLSTQMAARTLRYNWFEELRSANNFDFIALAQHQNDAVETVLINLVRGTGISGLHGILPKRDFLIRPLLFLNADEIASIITSNEIKYVEDSSNASTNYTRNKLRHLVIPQLKSINPSLEKTFIDNSKRFAAVEEFLNNEVDTLRRLYLKPVSNDFCIEIKNIVKLKPAGLLLFEILKPFNFNYEVIEDIIKNLHAQSGKIFYSATHQLLLNRDELVISIINKNDDLNEVILNEAGTVNLETGTVKLSFTSSLDFEKDNKKAFVDADLLIYPLKVRYWQHGDKFMPIGMTRYKRVSDFFIDEKLSLNQKKIVPIVVNGNNEIVWLAGARTDNRYKITKATKKVAIFEVNFSFGK